MRSKTYALRSWRKNHSSASIDIWSLQKQTHFEIVREVNLILKNAIIYFRVFTGWFLSGCIRKWSFFDNRIKSWRGWWSKTLHIHLMSNHSVISARFGLCHVILTTPPGQHSAWKWNFGKTKNIKRAASIFFLSETHNDQSAKKLPHLPIISNNVEI